LQKDNDEESVGTWPTPTLRRSGKLIGWGKKKKNTKRSISKTTPLIYRCCKRKGHNTINFWYLEAFSFCRKRDHLEASCKENQAICHKLECFQRKKDKKTSPIQQHQEL
jgi:hypothetical protein